MYPVFLMICLPVAYLSGSINFAILISRWARGIDIRTVGSRNPGTANVGREVGKGWAALVFLGDLAKGLVPLILAKALVFPEGNLSDYLALFLMGMLVITGHCWPVFHRFKGGGGLATSIGVYMFFVPVEFFLALLVSYIAVVLLFRKKQYAYGQIVPMFFVPLAPLFVLLSTLFVQLKLGGTFRVGGHPWYVVAGISLLSLYIVLINIRIVKGRFSGTNSV
jgi:glycerol-3-phosphate acyltransferase PlsY